MSKVGLDNPAFVQNHLAAYIMYYRKARRIEQTFHRQTWVLLSRGAWTLADFGLFYLSLFLYEPVLSRKLERDPDFLDLRDHLLELYGV